MAQGLQALGAGLVVLLHERLFLNLHLSELALLSVNVAGHGVELHPQAAAGLIDQVDCLVGQEAVGDVAVGELGCSHQSRVGDTHAVVDLVLLLDATQDGDGVLHRGLVDHDRLETPGKSRILLDVLAVLVERRGTDGMQLATGKGGLQDVGGIHGAAGGAGAHDGVQLIDEQDDVAASRRDLLEHGLQAVLELAAVFGACHHGAHVELDELTVTQGRRHVAGNDSLRKALDDGRLAGTGLADEHGIVLRAARKHLHRVTNLLDAADDRVELALAGQVGQVAAILLERLKLGLALGIGHARVATELLVGVLHALGRHTGVVQDATGVALVACKRDKQVLGGGKRVAHLRGKLLRSVEHAHEPLAHAGLGAAAHAGLACQLLINDGLELGGVGTHTLDNGIEIALGTLKQGLQKVKACNF